MKNKLTCACLLLGGMLLTASCEDTDALKNDINSLEERVEALENQVAMFNENIASLHTLLQKGVIISSYTHDATKGTYTLTLSDGTVLTLAEKTADFGNTPLVSVDANNNWQVSYDNGTTFTPVTDANGNPVQALGEDGITPMFRINGGYWEISYDNGATYTQVLDEGGNPVQATYDASGSAQVFTNVAVDDDSMTLTLADGTTTVEIPIVPDFYCYFDAAITGEQTVQPGATATFNVHMNGAESTVVTAPTGWTAVLADDANTADDIYVLTLTAPQGTLAATKAVADNTRDVSILALKGGFATITKITVTPISVTIGGDEPTEPETPTWDGGLLTQALPASIEDLPDYSAGSLEPVKNNNANGWYWGRNKAGENGQGTVDILEDGSLELSFTRNGANNSYYVSVAGYALKGLDNTKKYKLSLEVRSDNGAALQTTMRNADNTKSFVNGTGGNTINTFAPDGTGWTASEGIFDLSKMCKTVGTIKDTPIENTTAADVATIDLRFYVRANADGEGKLLSVQVRNIKLEEYTE